MEALNALHMGGESGDNVGAHLSLALASVTVQNVPINIGFDLASGNMNYHLPILVR